MLCKRRHISLMVLFSFFVGFTYGQQSDKKVKTTKKEQQTIQQDEMLLKRNLTLRVYASETLESVIFRLENLTAEHFLFQPNLFSSYKAKAASYQDTALENILTEQLEGTSIHYFFNKTQLAFDTKK